MATQNLTTDDTSAPERVHQGTPAAASTTEWTPASILIPLRLSPHGVICAHAAHSLKNQCETNGGCFNYMTMPDTSKTVPFYNPMFYATSRAAVMGPGDTVLLVFPIEQPLVCLDENRVPTDNTELCWSLQLLVDIPRPFVIARNTPLENILTIPGVQSRMVAVTKHALQELYVNFGEYLTPPTPCILRPAPPVKTSSKDDICPVDGEDVEFEEVELTPDDEEVLEEEEKVTAVAAVIDAAAMTHAGPVAEALAHRNESWNPSPTVDAP